MLTLWAQLILDLDMVDGRRSSNYCCHWRWQQLQVCCTAWLVHCLRTHALSTIPFNLPYCNQLNAEMGFAWAIWYYSFTTLHSLISSFLCRLCVTFAFVVVIARGISARRRGDGMAGQLV